MTTSNPNDRPASSLPPRSAAEDLEGGGGVHKPADDREEVYYEGTPMMRGELGQLIVWWVIGLLLVAAPLLAKYVWGQEDLHWAFLVVPIVLGIICFVIPSLLIRSTRYRITNYRIDLERGIFSKRIDTLELWHVNDVSFRQSFFDRIFGVGDITIMSDDRTTPQLKLDGVPNPRPLFDTLKQRVIAVKRQRGVIKMDTGGHG
jgi:membrane protein YdbS with pleckstrin-like domain